MRETVMTKEQLAAKLNGREYTNEITADEDKEAKQNGLLVIFGASDDLCELRGVTNDEAGVYGGGTVTISRDGKLLEEIDDDDSQVLQKYGVLSQVRANRAQGIEVEALWCKEEGYSWTFKTPTPHATFEIVEGEEKYCRGIVLSLLPGGGASDDR